MFMTRSEKTELIVREAATLSEDQQAAALDFIRALKREPYYYSASAEALAALDKGLEEIRAGQGMAGEDVFASIDKRLRAKGV
jgi:predicted transcriptional regulator